MRSILIVEDDPITGRIYQGLLRMEGFEAKLAQDGVEAIDSLSQSTPDIVLLDLMLPRKNGVEVLKHIRSRPTLRDLPVIIFSNAYLGTLMSDAIQAGATHCLAKSRTQPKQVIKTIVGYLAASQPAAHAPKTDPTEKPRTDASATQVAEATPLDKRDTKQGDELGCALGQISPLLLALRECLRAATRSAPRGERDEHLTELSQLLGSLASIAQEVGLDTLVHVSTALEAVTDELRAKHTDTDSAALRTVAQGLDCIAELTSGISQSHLRFSRTPLALLLHNDPAWRPLATESLIRVGLHCVALADPLVGLEVLSDNRFDLVILDNDLPKISGFEFCRQLRERKPHTGTPFLLLADPAAIPVWAHSVMRGEIKLVRKPLSPSELAANALLTILQPGLNSPHGKTGPAGKDSVASSAAPRSGRPQAAE